MVEEVDWLACGESVDGGWVGQQQCIMTQFQVSAGWKIFVVRTGDEGRGVVGNKYRSGKNPGLEAICSGLSGTLSVMNLDLRQTI